MNRYDEREQDHPLDESTSARVQHFDADGYVLPDVLHAHTHGYRRSHAILVAGIGNSVPIDNISIALGSPIVVTSSAASRPSP